LSRNDVYNDKFMKPGYWIMVFAEGLSAYKNCPAQCIEDGTTDGSKIRADNANQILLKTIQINGMKLIPVKTFP